MVRIPHTDIWKQGQRRVAFQDSQFHPLRAGHLPDVRAESLYHGRGQRLWVELLAQECGRPCDHPAGHLPDVLAESLYCGRGKRLCDERLPGGLAELLTRECEHPCDHPAGHLPVELGGSPFAGLGALQVEWLLVPLLLAL